LSKKRQVDASLMLRTVETFLVAIDREIERAWNEVDRICAAGE
jgi:hypothetical protein